MEKMKLSSLLLLSAAFVLASCANNNAPASSPDASSTPAASSSAPAASSSEPAATSSAPAATSSTPSSEPTTTSNPTSLSTEDESSEPAGESTEADTSAAASVSGEQSSEPIAEKLYYVVGSFNDWTGGNEDYALHLVDELKDGKAVYKSEAIPMRNGASYKILSDEGKWFPEGMGNDSKITEDGDYVITFVPQGGITEAGWNGGFHTHERVGDYSGEETETLYYLAGTFNDWTAKDPNYLMAKDEPVEGKDVYTVNATFEEHGQFKVVDSNGNWYPSANIMVNFAGDYIIKYAPEGGITDQNWSWGQFYVWLVKAA